MRLPSATASGNSDFGTSSGWMACHAGRFTAPPRPRANVSKRSEAGVTASAKDSTASPNAATSIQVWVTISRRRRSTMSASAPAGTPTRKTGRSVAVCTNATRVGEALRSPMSHAAPTFCIIVPMFEAIWAMKRARKTRWRRGAQGDARPAAGGVASAPVVAVTNRPT